MITAFTAGLLLIGLSELGDKTFFMAMLLAMRYSQRLVFSSVMAALAAMTLLSVLLGQALSRLPGHYIRYGAIVLFLAFGFKLLYDASKMSGKQPCNGAEEAVETLQEHEQQLGQQKLYRWFQGYPKLALWIQAFMMTFLAEWGDRTQFSTIALAASHNPLGVTVGAILGHGICSVVAVVGGRLMASRISERLVTAIGGGLFILFGAIAGFEATT